jgi:hypothetical protein
MPNNEEGKEIVKSTDFGSNYELNAIQMYSNCKFYANMAREQGRNNVSLPPRHCTGTHRRPRPASVTACHTKTFLNTL